MAQPIFGQLDNETDQDHIDTLIRRVEHVLSDEWFIVKQKNGFDVMFCRSCNDAYLDSVNNKPFYNQFEGQKSVARNFFSREAFFTENGPDSVCYLPTASRVRSTDTTQIKKLYKANGIMKISVRIAPKWTNIAYVLADSNNTILKNEILKEDLGKTDMSIFEDYRYWIPTQLWLLERIKNFDFSFKQLPYSSVWFNYSIFIYQDKPIQFCKALYCDPTQSNYYKDERNNLEHVRAVALNSIAYALGIKDYKILN